MFRLFLELTLDQLVPRSQYPVRVNPQHHYRLVDLITRKITVIGSKGSANLSSKGGILVHEVHVLSAQRQLTTVRNELTQNLQ